MSDEFIKAKRWEGKPLGFKWKYLWANHPEVGLLGLGVVVVFPLMAFYRIYNYPGSINEAMKKYKYKYRVVRDDDPRLPEIIAQKEMGRHYFPS